MISARAIVRLIGTLLLLSIAVPAPADAGGPNEGARILVLALDGVPLRSIVQARAEGAFADWPEPVALVSTFPSLTNVGFTAIFEPFDVDPAQGYEVRYFDLERNSLVGSSPIGYRERAFAWRDRFDVTGRTVGSKLATYTGPNREAWKQVDEAESVLLQSESDLVMAHIGATDALIHLRGDEAILRFLLELDTRLARLRRRHLEERGVPLRVVMLSDHGNGDIKVAKAGGVRHRLRQAGLNPVHHLQRSEDVVAPTFGLVGYGALYMKPAHAAEAAGAVADDAEVDLSAWRSGAHEVTVVSRHGMARFDWHPMANGHRAYRYETVTGDPLLLGNALVELRGWGLIDPDGYADEDDWFRITATGSYPDPLRRLGDALTGAYVDNQGAVVFSLRPGYAWGWVSAHVSARLAGGRLEATHGGLDRESSLGFYMDSVAELQPQGAVRADRALAGIAAMAPRRSAGAVEHVAGDVGPAAGRIDDTTLDSDTGLCR